MSHAFSLISATTNAPLYLFGDHSSRHIPERFDNLGLSGDDLTRHIAWDIGTEAVIRALAAHFGCGAQLAGVSRLVIDMNREPDASGLIPLVTDGTLVPGNEDLSAAMRDARRADYYTPYHQRLGETTRHLPADTLVISVHSFTPKPLTGEARATDIGLLTKHDMASAKAFTASMARVAPEWKVDINLPYSAYDLNYTVDRHIAPHGLSHLAIEMRQDHLGTESKNARMSARLIEALTPLLA